MKFKLLEKVFDSFQRQGETYFIYLNPTSQELHSKEDSKDNRGIIDDEGNLYMEALWIQNKEITHSFIIHDTILKFLQRKNKLNNIDSFWFDTPELLNNAVFVQRWEDTLDFYTAESYEIEILKEDTEKIFALAKKKNPFLNFHSKNIKRIYRSHL